MTSPHSPPPTEHMLYPICFLSGFRSSSQSLEESCRLFLAFDIVIDVLCVSVLVTEIERDSNMNLSFAGCGFLGIYHVGVASCFRKYAPHLLLNKISGASIGAIAASAMLCDLSLGKLLKCNLSSFLTKFNDDLGFDTTIMRQIIII